MPGVDVPVLGEVVAVLEAMYPPALALSWDRVGLVTGDLGQPVRRVHWAVDPTAAVVDEAIAAGADLLVTHHPLLLRGVHSVATSTAKGYAVTRAVVADLAIYSAHTNADVADPGESDAPGVNDALASACGLEDSEPLDLEEGHAIGRVGDLPEAVTLGEFAGRLAAALPPTAGGVRVAGDATALVGRVAVLGGGGDDWIPAARRRGADVYVTADLRHHPVLETREETRGGPPYLVDAGHFATEWLWLAAAADRLREALGSGPRPTTVETYVSTLRTDPWDFVVGAQPPGGAT